MHKPSNRAPDLMLLWIVNIVNYEKTKILVEKRKVLCILTYLSIKSLAISLSGIIYLRAVDGCSITCWTCARKLSHFSPWLQIEHIAILFVVRFYLCSIHPAIFYQNETRELNNWSVITVHLVEFFSADKWFLFNSFLLFSLFSSSAMSINDVVCGMCILTLQLNQHHRRRSLSVISICNDVMMALKV